MIQVSTDAIGLLFFLQACLAWVGFVLHFRQQARLRSQLEAEAVGRLPEITEPGAPAFSHRRWLPHTRATANTVPLPRLPHLGRS